MLTSEFTKQEVLLELNVPWEDQIDKPVSAKRLNTQILSQSAGAMAGGPLWAIRSLVSWLCWPFITVNSQIPWSKKTAVPQRALQRLLKRPRYGFGGGSMEHCATVTSQGLIKVGWVAQMRVTSISVFIIAFKVNLWRTALWASGGGWLLKQPLFKHLNIPLVDFWQGAITF